jgi:Na+-driven multidrug efflux pump
MRIFTQDPTVIAIGAEWIRILSYSYFVYGWWMVSVQAFNGSGDTSTPTKINLVFFWLIQIPLSWYLAVPLGWQHSGVFWGVFFFRNIRGIVHTSGFFPGENGKQFKFSPVRAKTSVSDGKMNLFNFSSR